MSVIVSAFNQRFQTIVADPPWDVKAGPLRSGYAEGWVNRGDGRSRDLDYKPMSVEQIVALDLGALVTRDAHLYLWTINRYVDQAFDVARAWGFTYSTMLVWSKAPMGHGLGGSYGISSEYVLFCRRGSLRSVGRHSGTVFSWKRPYDKRGKPRHSAKPPEFYEIVEKVSPGPYLELFARSKRSGWSAWGDEIDSDVEVATA